MLATCYQQRFNGTIGQQWAQRKAEVGAVDHFHAGGCHHFGQTLTTEFGGVLKALPALLAKGFECFFEAFGCGYNAVFPVGGFHVARPIQRGYHFAGELRIFIQNSIYSFLGCIFTTGQLGYLIQAGQFFQDKHHVFDWGVVTHCRLLIQLCVLRCLQFLDYNFSVS